MSYIIHASPFPGFSMTASVSEGSSVHLGTVPCDFIINGRAYRGTKVSLVRGVLHIDDKRPRSMAQRSAGARATFRSTAM